MQINSYLELLARGNLCVNPCTTYTIMSTMRESYTTYEHSITTLKFESKVRRSQYCLSICFRERCIIHFFCSKVLIILRQYPPIQEQLVFSNQPVMSTLYPYLYIYSGNIGWKTYLSNVKLYKKFYLQTVNSVSKQ